MRIKWIWSARIEHWINKMPVHGWIICVQAFDMKRGLSILDYKKYIEVITQDVYNVCCFEKV